MFLTETRKGNIGLFLIFVVFAFVMIVLFGLIIPFLININAGIFDGAQIILSEINTDNIENEVIRAELNQTLTDATASIPTQINILSMFFKYGWLIIIVLILLMLFMLSRQSVEQEVIR